MPKARGNLPMSERGLREAERQSKWRAKQSDKRFKQQVKVSKAVMTILGGTK